MKVYVKATPAARLVLSDVLDGTVTNITVSVSNRPYMCFDIWGNYINTLDYIKNVGCEEYVFPPKENKKEGDKR